MPSNNESTMKWKVDIAQLKAAMTDAKRSISLANAEFKNATAGIGKWQNSITGVEAKIQQLSKTSQGQKTVLQQLQKQYEIVAAAQGKDSAEAQKLKVQIENQQAAIKKTDAQLDTYNDRLAELQKEQKAANSPMGQLNKTIDEQEKQLSELKDEYKNAVLQYGKNSKEAKNLAGEIDKLSSELKDNKTEMSNAEKAADDYDRTVDDVADTVDDASGKLDAMTVAFGNLIAQGITAAISAMKDFAGSVVETGKNFDSAMSNVGALSGASAEDLQMLRDTAKEFGSSTVFSASEAADALGYMALAGWDANTSASALGGVLDLAASSGMELGAASDMVTDYMSAFNIEADKSAYFADLLAYAQSNANTTAAGLGEAFKNSAANMNAAGQDIETTTALLSMMANQGLKGSEAGTALTAVMRDMTAKMEDGKIAIGDTLIEVQDANGNFRDMTDIMKDVENATNGMGDAQKASALMSTFTSDSIKGLNLILNAGVDNAAAFEEELRNSTGTAKTMSDVMNDNLGGDMTALGSKFEGIQIAMYEKFEPALRIGAEAIDKLLDMLGSIDLQPVADALANGFQYFIDEIIPAVQKGIEWILDNKDALIAALAGIGAGLVALNVVQMIQGLVKAFKAWKLATEGMTVAQKLLNLAQKANPIGLVISLIAGLVAAFVVLWNKSDKFRAFWINLWKKIKNTVKPVLDAVKKWFSETWEKIKGVWSVVAKWFQGVWNGIKQVFSGVVSWFKKIFGDAWNAIKTIWNAVKGFFLNVWNGIKAVFAPVISFFKTLFGNAWTMVKNIWILAKAFFLTVWNGIKAVFAPVVEFFRGIFQNAWNAIKAIWDGVTGFFTGIWNGIKSVFGNVTGWFRDKFNGAVSAIKSVFNGVTQFFRGVWNGITSVFGNVTGWFRDKFSSAWNAIKNVFSSVGSFFGGIWNTIKSKFANIGQRVGDAIGGTFKRAINAVLATAENVLNAPINAINGLIDKVRGIPGLGGLSRLNTFSLPRLARGGVLNAARMVVAGENGAEAIVPLERNKQWIGKVAQDMLQALNTQSVKSAVANGSRFAKGGTRGGVLGGGATNQVINFYQTNTSPQALNALDVYRDTKSLLFTAKVGLRNV